MSTSRYATAPPEARAGGHLLRILGVGFGIAVIVGNTIGSGILLTPGSIAAQLRHPWLVIAVWTMGGAFAFFCTQSVVELGTMLPQAGGWFVYSRRAGCPILLAASSREGWDSTPANQPLTS